MQTKHWYKPKLKAPPSCILVPLPSPTIPNINTTVKIVWTIFSKIDGMYGKAGKWGQDKEGRPFGYKKQ
eukprot:6012574-Ditylum_brightwellii.AAC.1